MSEKIRVLLADDHPILTKGLNLLISEWEEFEVVGIAADGQQAVELSRKLRPDIVMIDMQMPKMSGAEAIRIIKAELPGVHTLALTTFSDAETASAAFSAGCDGYLLKVIEPERLRSSLISIAGGLKVFNEDVMAEIEKFLQQPRKDDFSPRDLEVLGCIVRGMTNAQIAKELGLQAGTVKNVVSMLLSKTGCISRAQLARYATEYKLV